MLATFRTFWRNQPILLALALVAAFGSAGGAISAAARPEARAHNAVWAYRDAHPGEAVPVIVQTSAPSDPDELVRAAGGQVRDDLGLIHGVSASVPAGALNELASADGVTWISLDSPVTSTGGDEATTAKIINVFNQEIQADLAGQSGNFGQGIGVAVVDTGIYAAQDFKQNGSSRVVATFSRDGTVGVDGYGHGSHVAGLVAGDGGQSGGRYAGVAPQANLIDIKVGDNTGAATVSDVVKGLGFVLANKDLYNIRVVNLSLQSNTAQSYTTDPLDAAVELLTFRGVLVVVAAGNAGTVSDAVSYSPANDPFVLTVGAVDDLGTASFSDDVVPSWSSRGTTQDGFAKPELYTPGRHMVSVLSPKSVLATQYSAGVVNSNYFQLSGTSMAAGVASGAAALVFNAHPNYTPGQVKAALVQSAQPISSDPSARVAQVAAAIALTPPSDSTPNTKPNFLLLQAAGFADPASISWGSISWGSISWGSISWGSISWGSISWGSISWGSISWGSISWGTVYDQPDPRLNYGLTLMAKPPTAPAP
jgi:serine protease AprX